MFALRDIKFTHSLHRMKLAVKLKAGGGEFGGCPRPYASSVKFYDTAYYKVIISADTADNSTNRADPK